MSKIPLRMALLLLQVFPVKLAGVEAQSQEREVCIGVNNQSYFCETGHCCGESQCCNYYYELWWFWLVWTIIIILSCCCVCHHRRAKLRLQQQQRQREINLIAYQGARNYSLLPLYLRFLPSYLLPPYEEVVNRPVTPPPPYSAFLHQQCVTDCNSSSNPEPARSPNTPSNSVPTVCEVVPRQGSTLDLDSSLVYSESGSNKSATVNQADDLGPASELEPVHACCLELEEELSCPEKEQLTDYYPSSSSKIENWHHQACLEIKDVDKTPGRHRRFTGDSGIEVCVCNRDDDPKELDGLIDGLGGAMEFCDSCNMCESCPRADMREEGLAEAHEQQDCKEQHVPDMVTEEPVCLLLDTINENELLQAHQHHDAQT
ncbi:WW domain binding protein 1-like a isoform X3 [Chiloscyllium plagiosum]|uniref:WW domain binding protein 1-like a isoform X3 n=1 Tax=Chiloscyllium plagiosum TaxID=36176 RepID=UPI001CB848D6|nr:WW domain binding protein 1-like a isoform X3 [Chiloscyllium plagiosum]